MLENDHPSNTCVPSKGALAIVLRIVLAIVLVLMLASLSPVRPAHADETKFITGMRHYVAATNEALRQAAESENPAYALSSKLQESLNEDASGSSGIRTSSEQGTLPRRYFLTNEGTVTNVKFQNPWGTCWSFAHLASIESAILKQKGAAGDGVADTPKLNGLPSAPDLSEHALAWYAFSGQTKESAGDQAGEGTSSVQARVGEHQFQGAPVMLPIALFANRQALTTEDRIPYTYKDEDGTFHTSDNSWWKPFLDSSGTPQLPFDKDWSLNDHISWSFTDAGWRVKEATMLPSPAHLTTDEAGDVSYAYDAAATDAIKQKLTDVGAVNIMYAADQSLPSASTSHQEDEKQAGKAASPFQGVGEYMNYGERSEMWCQYNNDPASDADHCVAIVGWDDSYSRDNFKGTASGWEAPPGDGAWLVKNSWGADDFFTSDYHGTVNAYQWGLPDEGEGTHSGFFWLSYYDHSITTPVSYEVEPISASGSNLYQYDYLGSAVTGTGPAALPSTTPLKVANIFTADEGEYLKAVSLQTSVQNAEATIEVYRLSADDRTPDEGTLVAEKQVVPEYGGIHRVTLDKPIRLAQGERFAVVQQIDGETIASEDGEDVRMRYINLEMSAASVASTLGIESRVVYDEAQTLVNDGETGWITVEDLNEELGSNPDTTEFGNALIKAYTDDDPDPLARRTVKDEASGISVTGICPSSAALDVKADTLHEASDHAGCNAIRGAQAAGHVLSLHDVTLSYKGHDEFEVSIPIEGREGETLTVAHCRDDGTLELWDVPVREGIVTVKSDSLSPFAVLDATYTEEQILAMEAPSPDDPSEDPSSVPDESDASGVVDDPTRLALTGEVLGLSLVIVTLVGISITVLVIRYRRKRVER